MTIIWYHDRRPLRRGWNIIIYRPYKALTPTLVRWLCGPQPPLFAHRSNGLDAPAPLPLHRKRRLSIESFPLADAPNLAPSFLDRVIGSRDQVQYTALQDQCPLFTKLPLELRLKIYRHVLGDLTVHILFSHVPSLTLPPRFSLRAYPFHWRLDFEICKSTASHLKDKHVSDDGKVVKDPDCITRERTKEWEIDCIDRSRNLKTARKELLEKWARKNGPLALLKTCRAIYTEALPVLYTTNAFSFSSPFTFTFFPTALLPSRLTLLRHLHLHFKIPMPRYPDSPSTSTSTLTDDEHIEPSWTQSCDLMRALPALQTLEIILEVFTPYDDFVENPASPLTYLVDVKVKDEFVVHANWPERECEREAGACFKIVRSFEVPFWDRE